MAVIRSYQIADRFDIWHRRVGRQRRPRRRAMSIGGGSTRRAVASSVIVRRYGPARVRTRLCAGGSWTRTSSTAARKPWISEACRSIAGGSSTGECDVAQSGRVRLRRVPRNGTAPLIKVPAPSGPAVFPLRGAPVARFCRRTSRRSTGTRTAATATLSASEAAPALSALG